MLKRNYAKSSSFNMPRVGLWPGLPNKALWSPRSACSQCLRCAFKAAGTGEQESSFSGPAELSLTVKCSLLNRLLQRVRMVLFWSLLGSYVLCLNQIDWTLRCTVSSTKGCQVSSSRFLGNLSEKVTLPDLHVRPHGTMAPTWLFLSRLMCRANGRTRLSTSGRTFLFLWSRLFFVPKGHLQNVVGTSRNPNCMFLFTRLIHKYIYGD